MEHGLKVAEVAGNDMDQQSKMSLKNCWGQSPVLWVQYTCTYTCRTTQWRSLGSTQSNNAPMFTPNLFTGISSCQRKNCHQKSEMIRERCPSGGRGFYLVMGGGGGGERMARRVQGYHPTSVGHNPTQTPTYLIQLIHLRLQYVYLSTGQYLYYIQVCTGIYIYTYRYRNIPLLP